jgi:serine O-acetyltransferase
MNPGQHVLDAIRKYCDPSASIVIKKLAALDHKIWSAIAGCDIPVNSRQIQRGVVLCHPTGVVIHPEVYVGERTKIFSGVVLGTRAKDGAVPFIERDCEIGAGAKILGAVHLQRGVKIGANAVVVGPKYLDEVTQPLVIEEKRVMAAPKAEFLVERFAADRGGLHRIYCKVCGRSHEVREGDRPCGPNAWVRES